MPKRSNDAEQPAEPTIADALAQAANASVAAVKELATGLARPSPERRAAAQQPSIGRVVHFVLPSGAHRPADILDVNADGSVALLVKTLYRDQVGQLLEWISARFDDTGTEPDTWHWPEYVPAKPAEPAAPTGDSSSATGA